MNTELAIKLFAIKQPYIKCDNLEQRNEVVDKLEQMGFTSITNPKPNELILSVYANREYATFDKKYISTKGYTVIHYSDFITSKK